ncbi:MAG: serine/threonine-protein kinase [Acidobacteria bacterium]|nr:serine/threonine-protein kinase [Acidobacteriota bacterium]
MNTVAARHRLGPYEIAELLGTGGMGEVYRARDTRLDREVALKVLRPERGTEATQAERLVREARLISTLNHPHIRAIYETATYDGVTVIVMEYLDGETLDYRLARRPLSVPLAITFAEQLAGALDAAHSHGIVHHDVKPANVMITSQGAKLLDFGIATTQASTRRDVIDASTVTDSASVPGTTAYMAPEQLEGAVDDPRSDIFALGVVMYEMLTGRKPFEAPTRARMIASILEHEPAQPNSINEAISPALNRTVMKCLAKDPGARWQSARDLASELAWVSQAQAQTAADPRRERSARLAWGAAAAAAILAVAALAYGTSGAPRSEDTPAPVRFLAAAPPNSVMTVAAGSFSISPDGQHLAFTAASGGGPRLLWIRSLDSFEARALSGTDDAGFPFWSPDSRTIAFFTSGELKTIDIDGSPLQIVTKLPQIAQWGSWGRNGDVLFTTSGDANNLYRVRASGGPPGALLAQTENPGRRVGGPEFLPDGEHFLLGVVEPEKPLDQVSIYVGTFTNPLERLLVRANSQAIYTRPGHILYMRAGSLVAQPFDASSRQTSGEPISLPEPAAFFRAARRAAFSLSQNGILAYRQGIATTQLTWFDRSGRRLGTVGTPGRYLNPAISPDASVIAITRLAPSLTESDIWLFEPRGERPLTSSRGLEDYAVWSPDGRRVVYTANDTGTADLYVKETASSAEEGGGLVFRNNRQKLPMDWTGDGRLIFLDIVGGTSPRTPLTVRIGSHPGEPQTLATNPAASLRSEDQVQVSPDGRWVAYVSDVSGSAQVYVRQFPDGQRRWQVSTDGGFEPKWRGDSRELFYIAADQQMMSVTIGDDAGTLTASRPTPLFRTTVLGAPFQNGVVRNEYAVTRDGQRFLVNEPIEGAAAYAIRVVVNWRSLLQTK